MATRPDCGVCHGAGFARVLVDGSFEMTFCTRCVDSLSRTSVGDSSSPYRGEYVSIESANATLTEALSTMAFTYQCALDSLAAELNARHAVRVAAIKDDNEAELFELRRQSTRSFGVAVITTILGMVTIWLLVQSIQWAQ